MSDDSKEYTGRAITHQELYFSHARSFNDPFDCLPLILLEATKKEFETYLEDYYDRKLPHISKKDKRVSIKEILKDPKRNHKSKLVFKILNDAFEQTLDTAGVLSLSEDPQHVLMWSHYADSHKGICLKFKLCEQKGFFTEAYKVVYQNDRPVLNLIKDSHEKVHNDALLVKADFWSYEKEWRMVHPNRAPGVHKYSAELLEGVIFGVNISDENKQLVKKWILELDHLVDIYQAVINKKTFSIDLKKL